MRIHRFESFINESSREDKIYDLKQERNELQNDIRQAWSDMENDPDIEPEGGKIADEWGGKLNKMEAELEKLTAKIDKMENPAARKASTAKEETPVAQIKKIFSKYIDDINQSRKSWPDRTVEEQAVIYKRRYLSDKADLEDVKKAIDELQSEKKLPA